MRIIAFLKKKYKIGEIVSKFRKYNYNFLTVTCVDKDGFNIIDIIKVDDEIYKNYNKGDKLTF